MKSPSRWRSLDFERKSETPPSATEQSPTSQESTVGEEQQVLAPSMPTSKGAAGATARAHLYLAPKVECPVDGSTMFLVPGGEFTMGSEEADESPRHRLTFSSFYIDRYPITNKQFRRFVETTGYKCRGAWTRYWSPDKEEHPVVGVALRDAEAYCWWSGKRLPTEAEWEKAARGDDGRRWPWGNVFEPYRCNCLEGARGETNPVGVYVHGGSPCKCMDMAGNVWEWTTSLLTPYPYDAEDGREDPKGSGRRVVRGGSWNAPAEECRCSARIGVFGMGTRSNVGFRCVKDL